MLQLIIERRRIKTLQCLIFQVLTRGKFWIKLDWKVSKSFPVSATLLQQLFNNKLCIWSKSLQMLVGRRGLEPRTTWLKVTY